MTEDIEQEYEESELCSGEKENLAVIVFSVHAVSFLHNSITRAGIIYTTVSTFFPHQYIRPT